MLKLVTLADNQVGEGVAWALAGVSYYGRYLYGFSSGAVTFQGVYITGIH